MATQEITETRYARFGGWLESMEQIREMLLIGLASYAEIDRIQRSPIIESLRVQCPDLVPADPTGESGTAGAFADALRAADCIMRDMRKAERLADATAAVN